MPFSTTKFAALLLTALATSTASAATQASLPAGCEAAASTGNTDAIGQHTAAALPANQLEIRTPVQPSVLPSGGRNYLIYELHLQNFASAPAVMRSIEVLDADGGAGKKLAEFSGKQLDRVLHPGPFDEGGDGRTTLTARQGVVAFLCLAFDSDAAIPASLRHRVQLEGSVADGPVIGRSHVSPAVLGRPLAGADWAPMNGPHSHSHHRSGMWLTDGVAHLSRRYAIDWRIRKDGKMFSGDARELRSYFAYAQKVLSAADGTVIAATDGMPDNTPRTAAGFEPAVPVTMKNLAGNLVVVDQGNGQYAFYAHLQNGSVRVKAGDRIKRGQWLGRVGNSGDSRWPHLHFQLSTNAANILEGDGIPFVFDQYRVKTPGGGLETRTREFPWGDDAAIDFGAE